MKTHDFSFEILSEHLIIKSIKKLLTNQIVIEICEKINEAKSISEKNQQTKRCPESLEMKREGVWII